MRDAGRLSGGMEAEAEGQSCRSETAHGHESGVTEAELAGVAIDEVGG